MPDWSPLITGRLPPADNPLPSAASGSTPRPPATTGNGFAPRLPRSRSLSLIFALSDTLPAVGLRDVAEPDTTGLFLVQRAALLQLRVRNPAPPQEENLRLRAAHGRALGLLAELQREPFKRRALGGRASVALRGAAQGIQERVSAT